jgi:hypothetical protein
LEAPPAKPEKDDDEKDKKRYMPPRVIIPLTNVKISEGEPFKLECKIDGYPAPKVAFLLSSLRNHIISLINLLSFLLLYFSLIVISHSDNMVQKFRTCTSFYKIDS